MVIFDIVNKVLCYLLSIDLNCILISDFLMGGDFFIVRVVILREHNLFLLPLPLLLLIFLPLLLSKLFFVQWILIALLSIHLAAIITSR